MKKKTIKLILIIVCFLIIIDQVSKFLVLTYCSEPMGNEYFQISIANNTGMAFGFNEGNGKNIFLSLCIIALILNFIRTQLDRIDTKTGVALGIVLAGGMSNLIDRIFRGSIIDFIKIYKFPIFNIADICVCLGWFLLIIFIIIYSRKTS